MKPKRHLHRDYHRAMCGKDASHILMTYEPSETNCLKCRSEMAKQSATMKPLGNGAGDSSLRV